MQRYCENDDATRMKCYCCCCCCCCCEFYLFDEIRMFGAYASLCFTFAGFCAYKVTSHTRIYARISLNYHSHISQPKHFARILFQSLSFGDFVCVLFFICHILLLFFFLFHNFSIRSRVFVLCLSLGSCVHRCLCRMAM